MRCDYLAPLDHQSVAITSAVVTESLTIEGPTHVSSSVVFTSGESVTMSSTGSRPDNVTTKGYVDSAIANSAPDLAKGQLVVYSTAAGNTSLPAGVNGQVLVANSESTSGVSWGAPLFSPCSVRTVTGEATLSSGHLLGGVVIGDAGAAVPLFVPTAANLRACMPSAPVGTSLRLRVCNIDALPANAYTVTANPDGACTVRGNPNVAGGSSADVLFIKTGESTFDVVC